MKFLRWLGLLCLTVVVLVAAPALAALALPFADPNDRDNVFPTWLQWLNTWDDPGCDQGLYEPQVAAVYVACGWYGKTWYWLGIRNQCYGLFELLDDTYDGSPVVESRWWKFKVYSCQGYKEITWPERRVSFGFKVHTLKTAKVGDPISWVFMPAFWKSREY